MQKKEKRSSSTCTENRTTMEDNNVASNSVGC